MTTTTPTTWSPAQREYLAQADYHARWKRWFDYVVELDALQQRARRAAAERQGQSGKRSVAVERPAAAAPSGHGIFTSVMPPELVPFFTCVANHESISAGFYGAVSPGGKYRGFGQFDESFWRSHAPAEWKHLADSHNWETAPPEVQDQTAVNGFYNQGPGAWNGAGCESLVP